MEKLRMRLEGIHCASCENPIAQMLKQVPGVISVQVSAALSEARIEGEHLSKRALLKAVSKAGYRGSFSEAKNKKIWPEIFNVAASAILTIPLILTMFAVPIPALWQLILATIVQFGFGWRFYIGTYYGLKTLSANMDTLIALGTSAAYFLSVYNFFSQSSPHLYFESSAAIITLVLLGRLLESQTKKGTSKALQKLMELSPSFVRVKRDNQWVEAPAQSLKLGEEYQVRPGEKVPVDGEVIDGSSHLDESMLTGEARPIKKEVSSKLFGGTLNHEGVLIAKATAVGDQTVLAKIIQMVKEAQSSRAKVQDLVDVIASYFVPAVLFVALLTFILWATVTDTGFEIAMINAVSVLVIACPCALGLATPTVIMVASGVAARLGILIRNIDALQNARHIARIAFDKTGTLTTGKPTLIQEDRALLQIAASLEQYSEHPIAKAILEANDETLLKVENFEAISGKGIKAKIDSTWYYLGNQRLMSDYGIEAPQSSGTELFLAKEGAYLGSFSIVDPPRQEAPFVIKELRARGLDVALVTGDQNEVASKLAKELNIQTLLSEVLPDQKVEAIHSLKQKGGLVAMVGDGINDAPALAASDVSFAMRTGSDIAMESASITLMHSDLRSILDALDLSKATFRKLWQNLFFAFIYNGIGIPLAAFGLLNPMIAAFTMAASSICVVCNALFLNRFRSKLER